MSEPYVTIDDWTDPGRKMCAPHPDDPMDVEWTLRYGTPTREQALVAASFISAYRQLVNDSRTSREKKIAGIRAASA